MQKLLRKILLCIFEFAAAGIAAYFLSWHITKEKPTIETCVVAVIGVIIVNFLEYLHDKLKAKNLKLKK